MREHFGQGRLVIDPARAVFINCPFDPEFEPTFDAILFSTVCCGFVPRSALESGTVAASRMEKDRLRQEWGTDIPWADLVLAAIDLSERMS